MIGVEGKHKRQRKESDKKSEALIVLFDFLISLLTKPYSILRDIANFVFKQFCNEIPQESLENLF